MPDEVSQLQALAGVELAVVTPVGHCEGLVVLSPHISLPGLHITSQSGSLVVVQFYLKSEGTVKAKGDIPALVVLVNIDLENVPLTGGPPGARLHPGTEGGLSEGRTDPKTLG